MKWSGSCWVVDGLLFLNMGTTFAVVQSVGIVPCFSEAWKNSVNVGVSSSATCQFVGMWSGPATAAAVKQPYTA